ncbi:MAG TPA: hypothetical protein VKQ30_03940 [Ktedonobacterales bacterium]|nr:hypothetical protein [Ktedonobacterales bacterium]
MVHDDAMPQNSPPNALESDGPDDMPPDGNAALQTAAAMWIRRGYQVRYRDAFLIQLLRRRGPGLRSAPYVALAFAALALAGAAWIVALRHRPWHIVTLVIGPDKRILTHSHRSPHPPAP